MANGHDPEDELEKLLQSGFVQDTLFPVVGRPEGGVGLIDERRNRNVIGQFIPGRDSIAVARDANESEILRALIHEGGHRLDFQGGEGVAELREDVFEDFFANKQRGAVEEDDRHAFENPNEYFPTAFERAMQAIRGMVDLEEQERRIPGTRDVVAWLKGQL